MNSAHTTTAMLMGATGLVGAATLPLLTDRFDNLWTPGRRAPDRTSDNDRVRFVATDFSDLKALDAAIQEPPVVLCIAFGTTRRAAGSQGRFREIDLDYPLALARWAQARGTRRICLVSAVGADPTSRVFYNRIKGELEQALRQLDLQSLHILRPSLLLGHHPGRPLEALGQALMGPLAPLVPAHLRPIRAAVLAERLAECATDDRTTGVKVLEGRALFG